MPLSRVLFDGLTSSRDPLTPHPAAAPPLGTTPYPLVPDGGALFVTWLPPAFERSADPANSSLGAVLLFLCNKGACDAEVEEEGYSQR